MNLDLLNLKHGDYPDDHIWDRATLDKILETGSDEWLVHRKIQDQIGMFENVWPGLQASYKYIMEKEPAYKEESWFKAACVRTLKNFFDYYELPIPYDYEFVLVKEKEKLITDHMENKVRSEAKRWRADNDIRKGIGKIFAEAQQCKEAKYTEDAVDAWIDNVEFSAVGMTWGIADKILSDYKNGTLIENFHRANMSIAYPDATHAFTPVRIKDIKNGAELLTHHGSSDPGHHTVKREDTER